MCATIISAYAPRRSSASFPLLPACLPAGARHLEESVVAMELARIEKTGDAIHDKAAFFFGANSTDMGHLLANPNVIKMK